MSLFFDTFKRRVTITGTLRCQTALRIGSGKSFDSLTSDLPVLRDSQGRPLLPGASIKGVVRSQVEALLRAAALYVCDPLNDQPDDPGASCLGRRRPKGAQKNQRPAVQQAAELHRKIEEKACRACRIFGAPSLASHVVFADALPQGGEVQVERRDGVAIDRDLGRARDGRKYDYEVVPAGTRYDLRVVLNELDEGEEGAVLQGLELLGQGFARLGGFKSRGLGEVALEDVKVKVLTLQDAKLTTAEPAWEPFKQAQIEHFYRWCDRNKIPGVNHA